MDKANLLPEVGESLAEVKVVIIQVNDDPWYYSCGVCKKGCPEV